MKHALYLFIFTMILFLTACTSSASNPAVGAPETSTSVPPALNTVAPKASNSATPISQEESPMPPVEHEAENSEDATQPATADISSGSGGPVATVDLSQITSEPPEDPTPMVMPQPGVPDLEEKMSHEVSQDLARRLGIDVSEVTVASSESREWPDSGLGCPDPNMNYLTVITPGFLINLEASAEVYTYHTDRSGNFVLCGQDGRPLVE